MGNDDYLVPIAQKIGATIIEFCGDHTEFHAEELHHYVSRKCGSVAPASADRILRHLRSLGKIEYVVDRGASLYTVLNVRAA